MKRLLAFAAALFFAFAAPVQAQEIQPIQRGTLAERAALTPSFGRLFWVTDSGVERPTYYDGTTWQDVFTSAAYVSGVAPDDATFITQTPSGDLSAEQALSALSSGIMRVATTTGVITSLTTSAGIAANISDETGSNKLVFSSAPTLDDYVQFTGTTPTPAAGQLAYDSAEDTLVFYDQYSSPMWLGHTLEMQVRNETGAQIDKGEVVYVCGGHSSGLPLICLSRADAEATTTSTIGVAVENIANNAFGSVLQHGVIKNIDTSSWTVGTLLYLDASVAGAMTSTAPYNPNFRWHMGVVTKQNMTSGRVAIFAHPEYNDSKAVLFTDVTTGDASTSEHGYLPKLSGDSNDFLDGTGAWSTPAGGSGGTWTLADSWDHDVSGDTATPLDFTGLAGSQDILIVAVNVGKSVSGRIFTVLSDDDGMTFYTGGTDYESLTNVGVGSSSSVGGVLHDTDASAARWGWSEVIAANVDGTPKLILSSRDFTSSANGPRFFVGSTSPVNAVRVYLTGGGNFTSGQIYCFVRQ